MEVQDLIEEQPRFHTVGEELLVSYAINPETLIYIDQNVQEHDRTLETGAGVSTVLFALRGAEHICIVPDQKQVDRIRKYCRDNQIAMDNVDFYIDTSERALPNLKVRELNMILIDGRHAFPTPFIDWYYTVDKLKVGGIIIIDDTPLWPVGVLRDFMLEEPEWQLDTSLTRSSAFIKVREEKHDKWWGLQNFVIKRSKPEVIRMSLDKTINAIWSGDLITGKDELTKLLEDAPYLKTDAEAFSREILNRIWDRRNDENGDEQELLQFADLFCDQLPKSVHRRSVRRYTLANLHHTLAVSNLNINAPKAASSHALRAIKINPRLLTNRELLSILKKSIL